MGGSVRRWTTAHVLQIDRRAALVRLALFGVAWLMAVLGIGLALAQPLAGHGDRFVYWDSAGDPNYIVGDGLSGVSFLYSPAAAHALALIWWLPFEAFWTLYAVASMQVTAWLVRPLGLAFGLPIWLLALPVSLHGNLEFLFALVVVLGLRFPGLWAIPLLTKITPGIGLVWFAVRREWRSLVVAALTTAIVGGVSFALAPGRWADWAELLLQNARSQGSGWSLLPIPLLVRVAAGGALVAWGARADRRWTIVAGMMLARPDLWLSELAMLLALPRLQPSAQLKAMTGRPSLAVRPA
jgi:hypothetical protein